MNRQQQIDISTDNYKQRGFMMNVIAKSINKKSASDQMNQDMEKLNIFVKIWKNMKRHKTIYYMALPIFLYYIIFHYLPMYGIVIAFMDYKPARGFSGSEWVGFENFIKFFENPYFFRVVRNTFLLNVYQVVIGFPIPIVFALILNEIQSVKYKKVVQTVTYMPHFVSAVVICGIFITFLRTDGIFSYFYALLMGEDATNLLSKPELFRGVFTGMNIWQQFGWGSIIYFAALAGIDPTLYEAAAIDGANRLQRVIKITLPSLAPTIVTLFILRIGRMMTMSFEKIILLYNPSIYETADVISSFVYRKGILEQNFSYGTSVGLFNSVINLSLILLANYISRRINDTSLW